MGKKVEIIDIELGINLNDEIKNCVDSLNAELLEHTKKVIQDNAMKLQKTNKRKQITEARDIRTTQLIKFLEEQEAIPDRWVTGIELLEVIGIEPTSQNVNKISMQVRKSLRTEDKWTLNKKRHSKTTVYRLIRFG